MKTIFILEDNLAICQLVSLLLKRKGYDSHAFYNVKSFLAALNDRKPDMMLIDVMLPDGNGLDLTIEFKESDGLNEVPILIMSANSDCHSIKDSYNKVDFIAKPFDIHVFDGKIASLIA
ncbi:MAG: response regulator [Flavobacterium sp.]|nr:response regulator [Candidatus Neoflavobacterium equi]